MTGLVADPVFRKHLAPPGHPEHEGRMQALLDWALPLKGDPRILWIDPRPATRLHCELLDKLHAQGSRGVFAEILASNEAVKHWSTRKLGYALHGEPFLVAATRGPSGERLYNQIVVRSLEDWQPGAWRSRLDAHPR